MRLFFWGLISLTLLSGCSDSNPVEEDIGLDPLLQHQWYLLNVGQPALSSSGIGGIPGADINAFSPASLSAENYAQGYTGSGVEVAVLDSGLEIGHEDLEKNVIPDGSYNFISSSNGKGVNDPTSNVSDGDHGTSVAGLIAGRGNNSLGIWGVAPGASLRGYNLLENQGLTEELASLGLASAAASFSGMTVSSVSVFNRSYGRNPTTVEDPDSSNGLQTQQIIDAMKTGTETLRNGKGAIYVKAAGNEYDGGSVIASGFCSEAEDKGITCYNVNQEPEHATPFQMVIGAFNANDKRSSYSNTGSALWVVGPAGEFGTSSPAMLTVDQSGCSDGYSRDSVVVSPSTDFNRGEEGSGNESCNYYSAFNGTSSATPVVSGVAALILEAYPEATWRDVKHIIATTARQLDPDLSARTMTLNSEELEIDQDWETNAAGYSFSNEYGFGAVDVQAAITLALNWKSSNTHLGALKTLSATKQTFFNNNIIANKSNDGLVKTQTISDNLTIESVVLEVNISAVSGSSTRRDNKIDASDYLIKLTSPSGTESILMTPFSAFNSGYDLAPFKMISHAFYGETVNGGDWTLQIIDVDGNTDNFISHQGEGKLDSFQLTFYGH